MAMYYKTSYAVSQKKKKKNGSDVSMPYCKKINLRTLVLLCLLSSRSDTRPCILETHYETARRVYTLPSLDESKSRSPLIRQDVIDIVISLPDAGALIPRSFLAKIAGPVIRILSTPLEFISL